MPSERLRPVWVVASAAVAIATAAALNEVLSGNPGEGDGRTVATLIAALMCGAAALAALEILERTGPPALGGVLLAASAADLVLLVVSIWKAEFDGDDTFLKLVPTGFAWAVALLVVSATALWAARLRLVAVAVVGACASAWAGVATALVWSENDATHWIKTLGVLAVLTVGAFLVVPLLRRAVVAQQ